MDNRPTYVLKRKRLSKTKTVVIFTRNNLNLNMFEKTENGLVFSETFSHHGISCLFNVEIYNVDIESILSISQKSFKVRGNKNHFGIFIRLPDTKLPISAHVKEKEVECWLECHGKSLYYDNGKKKNDLSNLIARQSDEMKTEGEVPATVSWAASHPFQGGSMTPK